MAIKMNNLLNELIIKKGNEEKNQLLIRLMDNKYLTYLKSRCITTFQPDILEQTRKKILSILENYFPKKYKLMEIQEAIVTNTVLKNDTFVRMPTGSGKSLCYQLAATYDEGITVVFSPLLSLIRDQIRKLKNEEYFVPCSTFDARKITKNLIKNDTPNFKLLFAVNNSKFLHFLRDLHKKGLLSRFIIDEAHCVSQWGSSFRPDYIKLGGLLQQFRTSQSNKIPIMALTATYSMNDCKDAINLLKMDKKCEKELMFKSRMERRNLEYKVIKKNKKTLKQLVDYYVEKYPLGSGIIYCMTVHECNSISKLVGDDIARPYYSQMPEKKKKIFQDAWTEGKIRVLCATSAFGMGIDKDNVNFVIHNSMPRSMSDYLQESGRAGRNGKPAECVILYNFNDQFRVMREIAENECTDMERKWKIIQRRQTDLRRKIIQSKENECTDMERKWKIIQRRQTDLRQIVDYCETNCVDLSLIEKKQRELPSKFLRSNRILKAFQFREEDQKIVPFILNKIVQNGEIKLTKLRKIFREDEHIIQSIIMSGFLRISLDVNSYKKCSPILTISPKGTQALKLPNQRMEIKRTIDCQIRNEIKGQTCNRNDEFEIRPPMPIEEIMNRKSQSFICL